MCDFGMEFLAGSPSSPTPKGYARARIVLGSFSEEVLVDTSVWPVAGYKEHWVQTAAKGLGSRQDFVFCSEVTKVTVTLWIAASREGASLRFYNVIVRRHEVMWTDAPCP